MYVGWGVRVRIEEQATEEKKEKEEVEAGNKKPTQWCGEQPKLSRKRYCDAFLVDQEKSGRFANQGMPFARQAACTDDCSSLRILVTNPGFSEKWRDLTDLCEIQYVSAKTQHVVCLRQTRNYHSIPTMCHFHTIPNNTVQYEEYTLPCRTKFGSDIFPGNVKTESHHALVKGN